MDNKPALLASDHKALHFPVNIFLIIFFVSIVMICAVAYSFHLGYKMSANFSPLIDASMEIQLEATTGHLWFEEMISGDQSITLNEVMEHIDHAIWYATVMLDGGENPDGVHVPLADPGMRKNIEEVITKINTFKDITIQRYETIQTSGVGTAIDQRYDAIFESFRKQADLVENQLEHTIASDLKKYRSLQFFLIVALIASAAFLLIIFYSYEKQRARYLATIREAHDQVKILSGFLPICASCKKIRDDQGYWNQIEAYIVDHSEAEFSHGICPDCSQELYPEIYPKFTI